MAKRGENIYKRKDGRWEGRYIKGRKPDGKIIYGYLYHQKYQNVKQQLIHYKSLYLQGQIVDFNKETVLSWMNRWLLTDVQKRVKPSTFASYQHKIQRYILPYIGNERLQKISEASIQQWLNQLEEQKLSGRTIRLIFQIFKMALKSAQKNKLIGFDPTINIYLPKVKKKKIHALSIKEQRNLEREAVKSIEGASIILSLYTGMRIGEISALKWSDIDFSLRVIHVQRTLQRIPLKHGTCQTQLIIQGTKTESSQRIIPFSTKLKEYLYQLKKQSKSLFVVGTKEKPLEPRGITYHSKKILKKVCLPQIHFHQLRHTFATRALEIGGDIASISALLGHYSPKFTLDIYTDSLLHQRKKIIRKLDQEFFYSDTK
ncbi:tyrosine-type recombinase/integrase [Carnobacterium maltaromaticum]|uniref:tyrosine-type recombinase/integrase n=1 Tax=Carnobacterium maltaromaticum TaxID=2751 RepID=UPI0039AF2E59